MKPRSHLIGIGASCFDGMAPEWGPIRLGCAEEGSNYLKRGLFCNRLRTEVHRELAGVPRRNRAHVSFIIRGEILTSDDLASHFAAVHGMAAHEALAVLVLGGRGILLPAGLQRKQDHDRFLAEGGLLLQAGLELGLGEEGIEIGCRHGGSPSEGKSGLPAVVLTTPVRPTRHNLQPVGCGSLGCLSFEEFVVKRGSDSLSRTMRESTRTRGETMESLIQKRDELLLAWCSKPSEASRSAYQKAAEIVAVASACTRPSMNGVVN